MIDLLNIVSSVFGYILFGFFVNKLQILPKKYIDYFDFTGFNILLPLALIIYFWQVSFPQINSIGLIISFFASGIFISMTGFLISKKFLNFKTDDSALFGLAACFGNTVAMGIPLMYAVLGPINTIPYMILVFFHGIVHFSYTVIIIEVYRNRQKGIVEIFYQILLGIIKNIVLLGTTSETPTLTNEERIMIVKDVWQKFNTKINIIVGIGTNDPMATLHVNGAGPVDSTVISASSSGAGARS